MPNLGPSSRDRESHGSSDSPARLPEHGPGVPVSVHRLLVDTVEDYAIFVLDPSGYVITWNPGAERIKQYTQDEIIGKHFSLFYPQDAVASGHPSHELAIAEEQGRYEEEGWRIRKDGSRFWARVTITALQHEDGSTLGFAKVTRDLTERKAAEEALRASEERFRLLVQSVLDYGIFTLDPEGHVTSWNLGAERIKGYAEEEILGRHFSAFYPEEERDRPAMELRVAARDGRFEDEGWRVHKDGSRFWANVVITALRDESGELVGFAKVTRDLTARREAELRAVEDARALAGLEAANRARSEFLTGISHDLRTPLNSILGYVDLLVDGVFGDLTHAHRGPVERIKASQQHLAKLVDDLLHLGRLEAGQVTYDVAPVSLAQIISEVAAMIEPLASARGIAVEWPEQDPDLVAVADRTRVAQIAVNLVTNAVKYTPPGGRAAVRYARQGDRVVLEVSDSGIGIPAEFHEAIFEPFKQIAPHESGRSGTGLGLAISRTLARGMGGSLWVRSVVGRGSTFTLELPGDD